MHYKFSSKYMSKAGGTIKRPKKNEDKIVANPELGIFVLADGMGGQGNGHWASWLAANSVHNYIAEYLTVQDSSETVMTRIKDSISFANNNFLHPASQYGHQVDEFGTTLVAVVAKNNALHIASVGDSSVLQHRDGKTAHITPYKDNGRQLEDYLGQEEIDIWTQVVPVQDNDLYLICSDGLTDVVDFDLLHNEITAYRNKDLMRRLYNHILFKASGESRDKQQYVDDSSMLVLEVKDCNKK